MFESVQTRNPHSENPTYNCVIDILEISLLCWLPTEVKNKFTTVLLESQNNPSTQTH